MTFGGGGLEEVFGVLDLLEVLVSWELVLVVGGICGVACTSAGVSAFLAGGFALFLECLGLSKLEETLMEV